MPFIRPHINDRSPVPVPIEDSAPAGEICCRNIRRSVVAGVNRGRTDFQLKIRGANKQRVNRDITCLPCLARACPLKPGATGAKRIVVGENRRRLAVQTVAVNGAEHARS